jgi:hypothetical protein
MRGDPFARHSRESGNPWTLLLFFMSIPKRKSMDSRFRGNDGWRVKEMTKENPL